MMASSASGIRRAGFLIPRPPWATAKQAVFTGFDRLVGNPAGVDLLPQVLDGSHAVAEVVLVEHLAQPDRDRLEVVPGEPAVRGEPFGEDEVRAAARRELVVVHRRVATDVGEAVPLRAER